MVQESRVFLKRSECGEELAELFIRFYLNWSEDNQLCCLFPYQMLRGQNSVTFLKQIILAVIVLKWKMNQRHFLAKVTTGIQKIPAWDK